MMENSHIPSSRIVASLRETAATRGASADFLFRESAERLLDRLDDVKRTFPVALDVGCRRGELAANVGPRGGIETFFQCDVSLGFVRGAAERIPDAVTFRSFDEHLPIPEASVDLVLSNLNLHGAPDLLGTLRAFRRVLKPGGLLLASVFAAENVRELTGLFERAEKSEASPPSGCRLPGVGIKDLGDSALKAGLRTVTVDRDSIEVRYSEPLSLLRDLRDMGELDMRPNRVSGARLSRAIALRFTEAYRQRFEGDDGRVPATFSILTLTAWAPD